jgi:hypothetical protein
VTEHEIQQRILLACGRGDTRLFRNNVGTGWVGRAQQITYANAFTIGQTLRPGDVVVRQARPLHAGLCVGSGDLIGWRTITVTAEMVGIRLAVFCSIEVKGQRNRPTEKQLAWDATVRGAGGLSGIARSIDDARGILDLNQLPK